MNFELLLILIAVFIVLLELLLRIALAKYRQLRPKNDELELKEKFDELENSIPAVQDFLKFDKRGIYYQDFVVYLQYPFQSACFNLNSKGFRCPEFTWKKMDPHYRIVALGSSALLGIPNCADNEIITHYLQTKFDKQGDAVEVINLAIRSYHIMNELNLLYRVCLDLEFDGIVVFDGYNDIFTARQGNVFGGYRGVRNFLSTAWHSRMHQDESWFLEQVREIRKSKGQKDYFPGIKRVLRFIHSKIFPVVSGKKKKNSPPQYEAGRKFYLQHVYYLILLAKAWNKPILFCHQPCLYHTDKTFHKNERLYYEHSRPFFFDRQNLSIDLFKEKYERQIVELEALCKKQEASYLNISSVINQCSESEHVFHDYCHLTPRGNELTANYMFEQIAQWPT